MKNIETIKERGIYDIDILDDGKELIGLTVDTKRKQYFVVLPEDQVITKDVRDSYLFLRDQIINKIADKRRSGELHGDTKVYVEELLSKTINDLGILPISEKEHRILKDFDYDLSLYHDNELEENSFYTFK